MARAGANSLQKFSKDLPSPVQVLVAKNFRTKSFELTDERFQFQFILVNHVTVTGWA